MSDKSAIEWTDSTWNPTTGCTKVSPGCAYCYAERVEHRWGRDHRSWGIPSGAGGRGVTLHDARLNVPLLWTKPRMVFVDSMSDLFHEEIPDDFIGKVFAVMWLAGQQRGHIFQVLTKRPERAWNWFRTVGWIATNGALFGFGRQVIPGGTDGPNWPLHNVWVGVSVENQRMADLRLPILAQIPAAVRFVSCEPLLGKLNLRAGPRDSLDWVIVGGESGGPAHRRLVYQTADGGYAPYLDRMDWVRSIRDQCSGAGVPFFFKQWGGPTAKAGGAILDGRKWREIPDAGELGSSRPHLPRSASSIPAPATREIE